MVSEMVSSFTTQNNSNAKRNYKTRYSRNPTIRRFGIRELHDNRSSIRFKRTHYAKKQNSRNDLHTNNKTKKQIVIKKRNISDFIILPVSLVISLFMFFIYDYPLNYVFSIAALIPITLVTYSILLSNHVKNTSKKIANMKSNRSKISQQN